MRQIRIYLLVYSDQTGWESSAHRDLDDVMSIWLAALEKGGRTGFVHVGLSRPPNIDFEEAAASWKNRLLVSASARWAFDSIGRYSHQIGHAGSLAMHLALAGWGYSADAIEETTLSGVNEAFQEEELSHADLNGSGRNQHAASLWLKAIERMAPQVYSEAIAEGVIDETSYLKREQILPWHMRKSLGAARAKFLMRDVDHSDVASLALALPPWLYEVSVERLDMTVRCKNCLRLGEVNKISQIRGMTSADFLRIPNFGKKSLNDLADSLWTAIEGGPHDRPDETPASAAMLVVTSQMPVQQELLSDADESASVSNFEAAFRANLARLKEKLSEVLKMRIGIGQERMTLEEIGNDMHVTRERIRQFECRATDSFRFDPIWQSVLVPKIAHILEGREDALPVASLGLFDPFFVGVDTMQNELRFILRRVLDNPFHVITINNCDFITEVSSDDWSETVKHALNAVERSAPEMPLKTEIRRKVEGLLGGKGSELASELWAFVQRFALFSTDAEGAERLSGVGTSAENLVMAILASSERPLHFSEIHRKICESFGRSIDVRRTRNAAGNVGILYGRGTYGAMRHCPLRADELALLREEAEEIVISGPKGRQWSCFELAEKLRDLSFEFDDLIDQYVVNLALHDSAVLSTVKRLIWVQTSEKAVSAADRIDVSQAVISLLQAAGRPMSRSEIQIELSRDRGLGSTFQIQPRGPLVKIDEIRWGLLDRDFLLGPNEIDELKHVVAGILDKSQKGLHVSETLAAIAPHYPKVGNLKSAFAVHGILTKDPRFKTTVGGYVYPASWEGPRRVSPFDAVSEVVRRNPGAKLTRREISSMASEILGREIDVTGVNRMLTSSGAQFDESSGLWCIASSEEED